ncbi:hypothetical protein J40TS1_05440 [Paenibacillus montaniterrae]|uniref:Enterochelin esterase n=1 Tax=Paenibacillus montaniterrae TaxID=429341 RepID=A0A920CSK5_9BACL|nr:alpha/beta hydrolase-fold protein [Paenibacillus montaniterrae]GIP14902.1 hypothetical protein J40TS1_05440 [Paenibacillus montaniterrae]
MTDDRFLKRTILKDSIDSSYLIEGKRNLRIYLPPGYNEVLSYPVIYCQDGEDFFNFGRIATSAQQLILDEGIEPFIIVGVDVDKSVRTEEYSPDGTRHQAYVDFFALELLPYIEGKYPVRQNADERVLAGDSLGGTVSLHIALQHPELFTRVMSMSGAFYEASQAIVAATGDLDWLTIFMIVGLQEEAFETDRGVYNFVQLNRDMHRLLQERNATIHYEEKDGKHQWGFWQKEVPQAIRYFIPQF